MFYFVPSVNIIDALLLCLRMSLNAFILFKLKKIFFSFFENYFPCILDSKCTLKLIKHHRYFTYSEIHYYQ